MVTNLNGTTAALAAMSCKDLLDNGYSTGSGTYWLDPDGTGSIAAFQGYCDMTADGGGWTLVAKTNGTGTSHIGTTAVNLANMSSNSTATAGYVGDSTRLLLGQHYRINACSSAAYFRITNTLSFSQNWGNPNSGCTSSATYNANPATYSATCFDDGGAAYALGYGGTNWARSAQNGNGAICGTYGNAGLLWVR